MNIIISWKKKGYEEDLYCENCERIQKVIIPFRKPIKEFLAFGRCKYCKCTTLAKSEKMLKNMKEETKQWIENKINRNV